MICSAVYHQWYQNPCLLEQWSIWLNGIEIKINKLNEYLTNWNSCWPVQQESLDQHGDLEIDQSD